MGGAIAAALIYLLGQYYVFPSWDALKEASGRIDIQSKRVLNYRKILRGQETVKAVLDSARQQTSSIEAGLLTSRSDSLANAEIQGLIKELAGAQGLNLRRSDVLPVKRVSPEYGKVSTRVELMGSIDQLLNFLVNFQSAVKILFIEEMRISAVQIGNPKEKQIVATLLISALKFVEPASPASNKK